MDKIRKSSVYENIAIADINGSMFYQSNFVEGTIYVNQKPLTTIAMRYNALNDEFEVKEGKSPKVQAIAKTNSVSLQKKNEHFWFKEYVLRNGSRQKGYLIALVSTGKYRLFEKRAKVFKQGSDAKTSFHKTTPHRFMDKIEFYISKNENVPIHTKKTKKEILSFLDKEDALKLKQFLKNKKGVDFGNTKELVGILTAINAESRSGVIKD